MSKEFKENINQFIYDYRVPRYTQNVPRVNITLKPHQTRIVKHMRTHSRILVVHGTGTGKTYTAAMCARDFLNASPENKVLFVSPLAVSAQAKKSFLGVLGPDQLLFFTTYDLMRHRLTMGREIVRQFAKESSKNTMIIADEAHYLTEDAKKTEIFTEIFAKAKKLMLFTATPVESGNKSDLLPYVRMLDPGKDITKVPDDYEKYFKCKISFYETSTNSNNFPRLESPNHTRHNLTENERRRFLTAKGENKTFAKNLGILFGPSVFMNRTNPKFTRFLEIYHARPFKTIVYFIQSKPIEQFVKFLTGHGISSSIIKIITGKTPSHVRTSMVKNDPIDSKTIFILTSAGKEGLDFKGVRNIVFMNHPWGPSNQNQVIGRGRRYLSHHLPPLTTNQRTVKVFHLEYTNTLNTTALNAISTKRERIKLMMNRLRSVSIESQSCTRGSSPNRGSPQKRVLARYIPNINTGKLIHGIRHMPGIYRPLNAKATHFVGVPTKIRKVLSFRGRTIITKPRHDFKLASSDLTGYTGNLPPSPKSILGKRLAPNNNRPTKKERINL
jgi:superfamily II DNA or RNA helicase